MGETCGRAQPASRSPPRTSASSLRRVMIDPPVGVDESGDTLFIELVELIDPSPCRQSDFTLQPRIRRKDDLSIVPRDDGPELRHEVRALAAVLDHDPAVLEVVDLQFLRDGRRVHTPRSD